LVVKIDFESQILAFFKNWLLFLFTNQIPHNNFL
jgi:hypothetical protein